MFVKQLSPILTLSDRVAIKNLVPERQDHVPVTQLRWLMDLRNRDEAVRKALGIAAQQDWDSQLAWYKEFIFDKTSGIFMIHFGSNFAGYLNFANLDLTNRSAEVGIKMSESYRGRGLGRQTFEFWCDMLLKFYDLNKLYLCVREHNSVAMELYESIGFDSSGCFPRHFLQDGEWVDYYIMTLYPDDFTPSTIVASSV